jgi:hypothetical protein
MFSKSQEKRWKRLKGKVFGWAVASAAIIYCMYSLFGLLNMLNSLTGILG